MWFIKKHFVNSNGKKHALLSVHSEKRFRAAVEKERLRTHRNGNPFSLLIFQPNNGKSPDAEFQKLVKFLTNRLRATDEIGWYSENALSVLLPDTNEAGAKILAEVVSQHVHTDLLSIEIQSYPKISEPGQSSGDIHHDPNFNNGNTVSRNRQYQVFNFIDDRFVAPSPKWKRVLDIFGASLGMILLLPVFLSIGVYIKFVSPGPVFFTQERIGFRKRKFVIWKFRTMHLEAETKTHEDYLSTLIKNDTAAMEKLDGVDPRIIPLGRLIRATGLDELPQLLNVLLGDMSLVGPRPCMPYEAAQYAMWQHKRFDSKPGLTGLWQVSGKNRTSFVEMMRLDIRYGRCRTIVKDILIMFKTFRALFIQVSDQMPQKNTKGEKSWNLK